MTAGGEGGLGLWSKDTRAYDYWTCLSADVHRRSSGSTRCFSSHGSMFRFCVVSPLTPVFCPCTVTQTTRHCAQPDLELTRVAQQLAATMTRLMWLMVVMVQISGVTSGHPNAAASSSSGASGTPPGGRGTISATCPLPADPVSGRTVEETSSRCSSWSSHRGDHSEGGRYEKSGRGRWTKVESPLAADPEQLRNGGTTRRRRRRSRSHSRSESSDDDAMIDAEIARLQKLKLDRQKKRSDESGSESDVVVVDATPNPKPEAGSTPVGTPGGCERWKAESVGWKAEGGRWKDRCPSPPPAAA